MNEGRSVGFVPLALRISQIKGSWTKSLTVRCDSSNLSTDLSIRFWKSEMIEHWGCKYGEWIYMYTCNEFGLIFENASTCIIWDSRISLCLVTQICPIDRIVFSFYKRKFLMYDSLMYYPENSDPDCYIPWVLSRWEQHLPSTSTRKVTYPVKRSREYSWNWIEFDRMVGQIIISQQFLQFLV